MNSPKNMITVKWLFIISSIATIALFGGCAASRSHALSTGAVTRAESTPPAASQVSAQPPPAKPEEINPIAYNYYANGLIFMQLGDYTNAAQSLRAAHELHPTSRELSYSYALALVELRQVPGALAVLSAIPNKDIDIYLLLANCYRMAGDEVKAHEAYRMAAKVDPQNLIAFSFIAAYYRTKNHLDSAQWAYENIARIRPDNFRVWNDIATLAMVKKDTAGSVEALRHSLEINGGVANSGALTAMAQIYLSQGRLDSAGSYFQRALALDPNSLSLLREMANIYLRQDSILQALPYAKRLSEISQDDRMATRLLGGLYIQLDSLDAADSLFNHLLATGDRNIANYYYLGRIAIVRKQYEAALPHFQSVLALNDTLAESYLNLGFTYRQLGQLDSEIDLYRRGLTRMQSDSQAILLTFGLAAAYERTGDIDQSTELFENILKNQPRHAQSLNYLGYMLADRNMRLEYALELIAKAVELDPDNAAYLDSYGWAYYRLGDYAKAVTYLTRAAELTSDPIIFDHLGDAHKASGNQEAALVWWQKALELQPDNETIKSKLSR